MKKLKSMALAGVLVLTLAISSVAMFTPTANASGRPSGNGCTRYNYSQGGYAACVGYIQRMLNGISSMYSGYTNNGYTITSSQLSVDNKFGPQTASKVKTLQGWTYLKADGIVGPNTWWSLCGYAGQQAMNYSFKPAVQRGAWDAARSAGCIVEY